MRRKGEDREGRGGGTRAALAPPLQRMRSTLFILSIADSQNAHKHTAADHMHTFSANVIRKKKNCKILYSVAMEPETHTL